MTIPLTDVTVARVSIRGTLAAGGSSAVNVANVFHYRRTSVSIDPTKSALAIAFNTAVLQVYLTAANVDLTGLQIFIRWLNDAEDLEAAFTPAGFTAGQVAGERLPGTNAVRLLMRSSVRGPSYRGAKSFAGVSEGDSIDDVLSGAPLALWQAVRAAVAVTVVDSLTLSWVPYVYSRTLSQEVANPTTIIGADVTSVLLNKNIGSMDRRRTATIR